MAEKMKTNKNVAETEATIQDEKEEGETFNPSSVGVEERVPPTEEEILDFLMQEFQARFC